MIHSFHIVEPAVAASYIYLGNQNSFENIYAFLKGYDTAFLSRDNRIKTYSLFHVHAPMYNGNYVSLAKKKLFPSNKYLRISEKPAWTALNTLSKKTYPNYLMIY